MPVDILSKIEQAILIYPGCKIGNKYRKRLVQRHPFLRIHPHRRGDFLWRPVFLVAEQVLSKFYRLRYPDAPMTEDPGLGSKQGFGRGIMKIDVVAVGENKFHTSQRIVVARFLANNRKPIAKAYLFHVFFSQIVRVLLHGWVNFSTHDAS